MILTDPGVFETTAAFRAAETEAQLDQLAYCLSALRGDHAAGRLRGQEYLNAALALIADAQRELRAVGHE